jgi:hypothetical protein
VLSGVDFRGAGGYGVAPPSRHPSGARYRWIIHDDLSRAPSWLIELIQPQWEVSVTASDVPVGPRTTAYGCAALRRALERLAQAPSGTRNDSLNRAAFALGQLVAALDEVETTAALTQAGQDLGLGLTECERTLASGLSAGMEQSRGMAIG